ncbi:uncharacterized protein LOC142239793 [Haematobia irritans]|uniref:uncharacterized protein LOC142239793 n=1 Tax=Haematobia irritans TaxID=7368 RepID=UPI003F4FB29A
MQQVWLEKIGWDDTLKPVTNMNCKIFAKNNSVIDTISVRRWIHYSPSSTIEIHGFCDASESAYAATLYVRVEDGDRVETFLLAAKTRVAPIKKISLPRLELCGAVMLSKLANTIIPNLQISGFLTHFWTDYDSFGLASKTAVFLERVSDVASRGCSPDELKTHHLWWTGPSWLKLPRDHWPKHQLNCDTNLEDKQVKVFATSTFEDPLTRFSSLPRAYRVLSYVMRFWRNTGTNRLRISSEEITGSELWI